MIIEVLSIIVILYILYIRYIQHRMHQTAMGSTDTPYKPIIQIPKHVISAPTPNVTATKINKKETMLDVTPAWFEPVKLPSTNKIRFPNHYKKDSPTDVRVYEFLSLYRSMEKKGQPIDFIAQPFTPAASQTEAVVVVLGEIAHQLGIRLSFTDKAFNYDDSDYRTACGVGNLGSIHSLIATGDNVKTAKIKLHMKLDYDQVTASAQTMQEFTVRCINDLAAHVGCKKEFIRIFSISRASSIHVQCGITTPEFKQTRNLAEQLIRSLNQSPSVQRQNILQYLIRESYTYTIEATPTFLQLQESDFDPRYNRDYPNAEEEKRGGQPYYFPQGWYRHALKVENKYPQDRLWLGMTNSPGEWCVAYHGTKAQFVKDIASTGLQHKFFVRDACKSEAHQQRPDIPDVNGLYVATYCEGGASLYTEGIKIEGPPGTFKNYYVVFQCRVENNKFTEHTGPVSVGLALRVFDEKAIRPYGILLKTK